MTFVCPRCTYPSRLPDRCDNPGCEANPGVTQSRKDKWRAEHEKRKTEEEERERIRQVRRKFK